MAAEPKRNNGHHAVDFMNGCLFSLLALIELTVTVKIAHGLIVHPEGNGVNVSWAVIFVGNGGILFALLLKALRSIRH